MKELTMQEMEVINGGADWHAWLADTAAECGLAAAATSENTTSCSWTCCCWCCRCCWCCNI